jgi:hypothetical protein
MVGPIEEIAHALAGKFRFTCQTAARYSVAQHCVLGSRLLPAAYAGAFLLHELSEVYLPDIASPLKPFVYVERWASGSFGPDDVQVRVPWADLEREHTRVILDALGLASLEPLIYSPEVKAMDLAMLAAEKRELFGPEPAPWNLSAEPAPAKIFPVWEPYDAMDYFFQRFNELFGVPS